ncbi:alpha/beta fold hydrolase [Mycoplasmopsis alligatoris]|uniref:AB hydrolase-1 domain-containing protein n=1 Tax=Mycoplasmopsis alligatoris A21JP2 TaxID=747682 RepID=D4XWJ2_9BACT|nr:alpha/beta fold hydrolase [Mycoplasmopsis alligatoris]EFF41180.1 conserved hypothetical protein [Mycoplasmopsis alligatoris A21JP2]
MNKIKLNNFEINYVLKINNDDNKIVLFLHGFGDSWKTFLSIGKINKEKINWASFDFPGCGLSSSKNNLTLEEYSKTTEEFILKILNNYKKIVVVSHSLGAWSALKNQNYFSNIILLSPFNYRLIDKNQHLVELDEWLLPNTYNQAQEAYLSLFNNPSEIIKKSSILYAKRQMNSIEKFKNVFSYMVKEEVLNKEWLLNNLKPLYNSKKNIKIISGTNDKFTLIDDLKLLRENNNIELIEISNAGHAILFEKSTSIYNEILKEYK